MNQLFLTSIAANVISSIVKDLSQPVKNLKLAFISTAAEVEEGALEWLQADKTALTAAGFNVFEYTLTGKKLLDFESDLKDTDVILVAGGNTFYLLEKIKQSGFSTFIKTFLEKGGIYIGSSAGSVVVGPDIWPIHHLDDRKKALHLDNYNGLNLVDFIVLPHWGNQRYKKAYMQDSIEELYNLDQNCIYLRDNQYIVVNEGSYTIKTVQKSVNA